MYAYMCNKTKFNKILPQLIFFVHIHHASPQASIFSHPSCLHWSYLTQFLSYTLAHTRKYKCPPVSIPSASSSNLVYKHITYLNAWPMPPILTRNLGQKSWPGILTRNLDQESWPGILTRNAPSPLPSPLSLLPHQGQHIRNCVSLQLCMTSLRVMCRNASRRYRQLLESLSGQLALLALPTLMWAPRHRHVSTCSVNSFI